MSNPNLKKYLAGSHHAKVANRWIPPVAKLNINTDEKVKIPGKLMYFDLDGRAGSIRMLLGHGNIKYTDVRMSNEEFGKIKASGALPLGSMPVW